MLSNFTFHYQPRYINGEISSYEALLCATEQSINIQNYVYSIEDTVSFDLMVIRKVLEQRAVHYCASKISIAINISINSLINDDFIEQCKEIFAVDKNIILELTNHDTCHDFRQIQAAIAELRAVGVSFALDDYGKGYINSEMLLHLDVDYIKLDRKLIENIDQSYVAYSLVRTTYEKIAKVLGKRIIVEGIETFEQLNLLKQFGEMEYQGFYFSKPLHVDKLQPTKSLPVNEKGQQSLCLALDQAIYDLNRAKSPLEVRAAIEKLTQIDHYNIIGVSPNSFDVYAEQQRINENYKEILENCNSAPSLLMSSLISTCDAFVIIRDNQGNAIYNNQKHIDYLNMDLVDVPVEDVCRIFPDYRTCLALDQELLNGDSCFITSNETVETESGNQLFHTYRQKLTHFGKDFVICSVYEDNGKISIDSLTGCFQKEYLESSYIREHQRLVFIDLDGFKPINDLHGHSKGDEVLRDFAYTMKAMLRENDIMIRFGGDEFIVLFDSQNIDIVNKRMEKIRRGIEEHFSTQELYLSFSYGIATLEHGAKNALEIADKSMYEQKYTRKLVKQ
ncbi:MULTISPECIES: GGDEF domain-containing protein [unclassified Photobacterium]|uniref:GGDEF domain-containing protein n=1 Tax=unclassified Photobacterium TaxID=2628852 RepID=UPI001EDFD63F|nr:MULTISPECIES: GGDEF domain-containing protein [unclassified Photobacterium]MCG3865245.1 GGDEF domain-containing protein [Photobacterium sp. Ph6]MCG3876722.1 GGDEF domain-containing protein [Photobacterium sp. Ph5]